MGVYGSVYSLCIYLVSVPCHYYDKSCKKDSDDSGSSQEHITEKTRQKEEPNESKVVYQDECLDALEVYQ